MNVHFVRCCDLFLCLYSLPVITVQLRLAQGHVMKGVFRRTVGDAHVLVDVDNVHSVPAVQVAAPATAQTELP